MTSDPSELERLAAGVGATQHELAAFEVLESGQFAVLIDGFEQAQTRQRAELEAGIEEAISHVPALMRRPILRILRGKE